MRVNISGSVEFVKEVEAAMAAADGARVEKSVRKRENAELQFGLQDLGDLVGAVKDLVELAPILWAAGAAFWKKLSDKPAPEKAKAPSQLTIDITAPLRQIQVTITPTSTVEQIKIQLT